MSRSNNTSAVKISLAAVFGFCATDLARSMLYVLGAVLVDVNVAVLPAPSADILSSILNAPCTSCTKRLLPSTW